MINTPIAELGFLSSGRCSYDGNEPIADVQYGDFLFLASDQIINNAAKMRYMSGGRCQVPLVMRAPVGATGRGSQTCPEHGAIFYWRARIESSGHIQRL